jgi:predicted RNA-binding protein YlqC (UPF0109 family)
MPNQKRAHPVTAYARSLLEALVRHPEDLRVVGEKFGTVLAIVIEANPEDNPKLIGAQGKHISALTRLFRAIGQRQGLEVVLDLIVPERPPSRQIPPPPFVPDRNWKPELAMALLARAVSQLSPGCTVSHHKLQNITVFKIACSSNAISHDTLDALDILFEAVGFRQGRVLHVAGPDGRMPGMERI